MDPSLSAHAAAGSRTSANHAVSVSNKSATTSRSRLARPANIIFALGFVTAGFSPIMNAAFISPASALLGHTVSLLPPPTGISDTTMPPWGSSSGIVPMNMPHVSSCLLHPLKIHALRAVARSASPLLGFFILLNGGLSLAHSGTSHSHASGIPCIFQSWYTLSSNTDLGTAGYPGRPPGPNCTSVTPCTLLWPLNGWVPPPGYPTLPSSSWTIAAALIMFIDAFVCWVNPIAHCIIPCFLCPVTTPLFST